MMKKLVVLTKAKRQPIKLSKANKINV